MFRAVALALMLALLAGCAALQRDVEPPSVRLVGVELLELGLLEQRFELALRVANPNNFRVPVQALEYGVFIDGQEFATGLSSEPFDLPALGEEVIRVQVGTRLLDNLSQLTRWQREPPDSLDYRLEGRARLSRLPMWLPFEESGSVRLR